MELQGLLIDSDVRLHLGAQALADVAARIEPSGDCVVCHTTLTHDQVSLTVHAAATDPLLVLPAHAACQPSALVTHPAGRRPVAPATGYHLNVLTLPRHALTGWADPSDQVAVPMLLINPNIDVQQGDVVKGRWQPLWQQAADRLGLARLDPRLQLDPSAADWTFEMQDVSAGTIIVAQGPGQRYRYPRADPNTAGFLQAIGGCLIVFCDTVRATSTDTFIEALRNGDMFGAWARRRTTSTAAQHTDPAATARTASGQSDSRPNIADLERRLADIDVAARAAFSDHRTLGFPAEVESTGLGRRVPVLLLEPRGMIGMNRTDSGARKELRVEGAIGAGLHRMPGDDSALPDIARDWQVLHHNGNVELTGPFGAPVARASLRFPPGWSEAADQLGRVIVVYGPRIGVRAPTGHPYNDADRRAELNESRRYGLAAWGITAWHTKHPTEPGAAGDHPSRMSTDTSTAQAAPGGVREVDDLDLLHHQIMRMPRYTVHFADTVTDVITPADLQPWLSQLWPVRCQTCSHALGAKAELSIDGPLDRPLDESTDRVIGDGRYLLSLHHATCRPSSTSQPEGTFMAAATTALAAARLGNPDESDQLDRPSPTDLPILVINPTCEQLQLTRSSTGWRNTGLDHLAALGFQTPSDRPPRRIRHARARYTDGDLILRITEPGSRRRIELARRWTLTTPNHIHEQIERFNGIAVAFTTTMLPTRMGPTDLATAFRDPAALVGWVPLEHS